MSSRVLAPALALGACLIAVEAEAHAHLVSSNPPVNGAVRAPSSFRLAFSEPLTPRFSGFDVVDASGRPAPIGKAGLDPANRKALVARVASPLAPGSYRVRWRAVAADTHRMSGQYRFRVIR